MSDNWPRTKRPMPWLIAGFLVMLFLVPFDAITFKVHLPMDSKPDRVLLAAMIAVWVGRALAGKTKRNRRRLTPLERAVLIYTGIALISIVLNIDRIYQLNELTFAEKRLAQMLGYIIFFFMVVSTVRMAEIPAYARLILVLTCLTAIGTLYEAHTGYNVFYVWSAKLLSPIATVPRAPTAINLAYGRPTVVGPTAHGLAVTSMLTIALPFAVLPLLKTRQIHKRAAYLVAIGLILAAEMATARKTAIIAPIAAFVVLMAYNRQLLRLAPIALIALIPVIHFAAPGTIGTLSGILGSAKSSDSTAGRINDYSAVAPDILNNLVVGRGYGTLNPDNYRWYRILDNEYLDELFQVGFLGLLAYLAIVITALTTAHGVIRCGGMRAPPTLAAAAGCAAYGVVSATFDATGFPQAPYAFLFAAGLIAAAAVSQRKDVQRAGGTPPPAVSRRYLAPSVRTRPRMAGTSELAGSRRTTPVPVAEESARAPV